MSSPRKPALSGVRESVVLSFVTFSYAHWVCALGWHLGLCLHQGGLADHRCKSAAGLAREQVLQGLGLGTVFKLKGFCEN